MTDSQPQLRMGFSRFHDLIAPQPPPGYGLRTFRPGDQEAWVSILATGEFGEWDRPRLDRMLEGERAPLPLAGAFFATHDDQPVGAACTFLHPGAGGSVAELGWVAVLPAHRGHGLALHLCRAVLGYVSALGHEYAYLLTEDFRLAAIKTYLRVGFEPEIVHPSHHERWRAVRASF